MNEQEKIKFRHFVIAELDNKYVIPLPRNEIDQKLNFLKQSVNDDDFWNILQTCLNQYLREKTEHQTNVKRLLEKAKDVEQQCNTTDQAQRSIFLDLWRIYPKKPFDIIPTEIIAKIFSHLDDLSLSRASRTCRLFHDIQTTFFSSIKDKFTLWVMPDNQKTLNSLIATYIKENNLKQPREYQDGSYKTTIITTSNPDRQITIKIFNPPHSYRKFSLCQYDGILVTFDLQKIFEELKKESYENVKKRYLDSVKFISENHISHNDQNCLIIIADNSDLVKEQAKQLIKDVTTELGIMHYLINAKPKAEQIKKIFEYAADVCLKRQARIAQWRAEIDEEYGKCPRKCETVVRQPDNQQIHEPHTY